MKSYSFGAILLIVICCGTLQAADKLEVVVTLKPLRDVYHPGEPVATAFVLKNDTAKELQIAFDYPRDIGLSFKVQGVPDRMSPEASIELNLPTIRMSYTKLAPGEEIKHVVALNKYINCEKAGRYKVDYVAEYMGPLVAIGEPPQKYAAAHYKVTGTLVFEVKVGVIDDAWIKKLVDDLEQNAPSTINEVPDSKGAFTKGGTLELLMFSNTPLVIRPLIAAGQGEYKSGADIVMSLQKFFKQHQEARSGILELGKEGDINTFSASLDVYEKEGVVIASEWFKPVLESRSIAKIYKSLEYLQVHGKKEDIRLVEPLAKSENEAIANLAQKVIAKLSTEPPIPPVNPERK